MEDYAAHIAPEIDRVRIALVHAGAPRAQALAVEVGLPPEAWSTFSMLRNLAQGPRRASVAAIKEVFVYQPSEAVEAALATLENNGFIEGGSDIGLSERGLAVVAQMSATGAEVAHGLWGDCIVDFDALGTIVRRVMVAAAADQGAAYSVIAPPFEPPGTSPLAFVLESLSPLRFHRFDAHVAAWRAAGLSVAQVQALDDGPLKQAIEADTNRRARRPYDALTEDERMTLLAGLRAMPIVAS